MATDEYTTSVSNQDDSYDEFDSQGIGDYRHHSYSRSITDDDADLRVGENTPDTILPEIAPYPDISMFCEKCATYVALYSVIDHRAYHHALSCMNYHGDDKPEDYRTLTERRRSLLKALTTASSSTQPVDPKEVQKINDAYEFLKADINDTYDQCRQIQPVATVDHVAGIGLNCSTTCALAVGLCSDANSRWKAMMEDTRVFQDYFGNDPHKCFFAVYDGHNGCCTAEVAANELHHAMLCEMSKFDPRTKCTCTFNMANSYDISRYDIHATHENPSSAKSDRTLMHSYSINAIQQIIRTCQVNMETLDASEDLPADNGDLPADNGIIPVDDATTSQKETSDSSKKKKTRQQDPFDEKMAAAFVEAHRYCDTVLAQGKEEYSRVRWSGCSTVCCVLRDSEVGTSASGTGTEAPELAVSGQTKQEKEDENLSRKKSLTAGAEDGKVPAKKVSNPGLKEFGVIHIANAGNIRAVLLRGNKAYCLSKDHTANNPKERARVLRQGGTISESERELEVNGVVAATRGLGNHGDPDLKHVVIADPSTMSVKIDQYAQMLVLASHGVWEVFSPTEVASILLQMLPSSRRSPLSIITSSVGWLLRSKPNSPESTISHSTTARFSGSSYDEIPRAPARMAHRLPSTDSSTTRIPDGLKGARVDPPESTGGVSGVHTYHATDQGDNSDVNTKAGSHTPSMTSEVEGAPSAELLSLWPRLHHGENSPSKEESLREFAKVLSERLVQAALMAGAKENITALVVLLPGCGLSL